jgi:putative two-component system response regulator
LHDIGKIGVPEELPRKPSPLTGEEYTRVSEHVRIGVDILSPFAPLARALPAIQDHHERWDGSGYPRGLAGEQISLGGRILAAVDAFDAFDAFDAMTSGRAYREPLTPHATVELLSNSAGTQFDPAVVAALRRVVLDRTSLHFSDEAH